MPFATIEGVSLFYEIKGNQQGKETIVFLNGVMASTTSWYGYLDVFSKKGYRIVLHDFKGQLKSQKPKGPYTFFQHAQETKELLHHLGIQKAHIIGTSYGGEVGMKMAMLYPELVQSLSIISSVSELDDTLTSMVQEWKQLALANDGEAFFWGMASGIYHPAFLQKNQEMLSARAKATAQVPQEYFLGQVTLYDTFLNDVTMSDDLHRIHCPTLVICGQDDLLKPVKFSAIIAQNIPQSEFVILPDCGHVAIFEKENELKSILLGFLMKQQD